MKGITRVLEITKEAKALLRTSLDIFELEEGYSGIEITSQYGDTEQRWSVVDSTKTREKKKKTLQRRVQKEHEAQS